jgi:hypothetical protein
MKPYKPSPHRKSKKENETEEERKARLNREAQRRWYRRHREIHKKRMKEYKESCDYNKKWYQENKTWHNLRRKLHRVCRPDICEKRKWESRWPGLDASDKLYPEDLRKKCEDFRLKMYARFRELFGRDPENGWKQEDAKISEEKAREILTNLEETV